MELIHYRNPSWFMHSAEHTVSILAPRYLCTAQLNHKRKTIGSIMWPSKINVVDISLILHFAVVLGEVVKFINPMYVVSRMIIQSNLYHVTGDFGSILLGIKFNTIRMVSLYTYFVCVLRQVWFTWRPPMTPIVAIMWCAFCQFLSLCRIYDSGDVYIHNNIYIYVIPCKQK